MKNKNEVVVITGGNSGIGLGTAHYFAEQGAKVIILSRREERNQQAVKAIEEKGYYADSFVCDVSDTESVEKVFKEIENKYGFIDVLFANAGGSNPDHVSIINTDMKKYDQVTKGQMYGVMNAIKFGAPLMVKQNYGRIIVTASIAAQMGLVSDMAYASSMAGKIGIVKTAAKELAPFGITVNAVCPGLILTEITSQMPKEASDYIASLTPTQSLGTPEDVAHAVGFLADPKAKWITGVSITLDGGFTLLSPLEYEMFGKVGKEISEQFMQ